MPPTMWDGLLETQPPEQEPSILQQMMGVAPLVQSMIGRDPRLNAAARSAGQMGRDAGAAARQYIMDMLSGKYAKQGAEQLSGGYQWDQAVSPLENARAASRDPVALEQAMNIAMAFGPGTIRAYHGSPHDFTKFSQEKIGTGEGAQAYGHGLYFAEKEATAKSYRDALVPQDLWVGRGDKWSRVGNVNDSTPIAEAAKIMATYGESPLGAVARVRAMMQRGAVADDGGAAIIEELKKFPKNFGAEPRPSPGSGRMYEVNINANPEDFLQWDKPLREQPKAIGDLVKRIQSDRAAAENPKYRPLELTDIHKDNQGLPLSPLSGGQAHEYLSARRYGGTPEATSQMLREAGIPGIRYLDQGSRGAGEGTANFVVFDPEIIEIIRKYGLAGILGAGGGAAALSQPAEAAPR